MRIVESPKEFADAFLGTQRDAAASFDNLSLMNFREVHTYMNH